MRYPHLIIGIVLMFALIVPLYYVPANCCGHAYQEGMTLLKILFFGHESCLVLAETTTNSLIGTAIFLVSVYMIIYGFGSNKSEAVKKREMD